MTADRTGLDGGVRQGARVVGKRRGLWRPYPGISALMNTGSLLFGWHMRQACPRRARLSPPKARAGQPQSGGTVTIAGKLPQFQNTSAKQHTNGRGTKGNWPGIRTTTNLQAANLSLGAFYGNNFAGALDEVAIYPA